jgi:hypothetical protein
LLDRKKDHVIEDHVMTLYKLNKNRFKNFGDYHINFLWGYNNSIMTDVWVQSKTDSWGSGPLSDPKIFKHFKIDNNIEKASGDTLLVLASEEIKRRNSDSFESYIDGKRPKLPFDLNSGKDFYI